MDFKTILGGTLVVVSFILSIIFVFVIPPILNDKGGKYKKYIKFIVPLAPLVIFIAVTLKIFIYETRWVISNQPPFFDCSPGAIQIIFFMLLVYFLGVLILQYHEK